MVRSPGITAPRAAVPKATPSQDAVNHQIAVGGGSDVARDRVVRSERRSNSLQVTGARVNTRNMLDQAGALKPTPAKKAR